MSRIENRVSRGGSVRAVFSRRCNGFAAPLDLVIAHLKAAILWRELWKVGAQNEAMRARVAADFAGYLVTDADDLALRALESVPAVPFAAKRVQHKPALDRIAMTGRGPWSHDLQSSEFGAARGALDAPEFIAAGAMRGHVGGDGFRVRLPVLSARAWS